MKSYGFGLAALAALAGPACAADLAASAAPPPHGSPLYSPASMVTGDISLGVGWTGENGNLSGNTGTGHVAGRTNFGLWSGWNEELEGTGVWTFNGHQFDGGGFSHTYYKNQSWASGFVLGGGEENPFNNGSNGFGVAGVEGVVFLPSSSFVGMADYTFGNHNVDYWTLAAEGRWYLEPNTKLTGQVAWNSNHNGASNEWLVYGALEHRWSGTPWSTWISADWRPASSNNTWGLLVGVRYLFDQPNGTLQSHDYEVPFSQGKDTVF